MIQNWQMFRPVLIQCISEIWTRIQYRYYSTPVLAKFNNHRSYGTLILRHFSVFAAKNAWHAATFFEIDNAYLYTPKTIPLELVPSSAFFIRLNVNVLTMKPPPWHRKLHVARAQTIA